MLGRRTTRRKSWTTPHANGGASLPVVMIRYMLEAYTALTAKPY